MPDEMVSQVVSHLFATYGPTALPIIGCLLIIKYFVDKDKERENAHKEEIKAERALTVAERKRGDDLQTELLQEARGSAMLAEEVKKALQVIAGGKS